MFFPKKKCGKDGMTDGSLRRRSLQILSAARTESCRGRAAMRRRDRSRTNGWTSRKRMRATQVPFSTAAAGECRGRRPLPNRPSGSAAAGGTTGIQGIVNDSALRMAPTVKQFRPESFRGGTNLDTTGLVLQLRRQELVVQAGDASPLFKGDLGDYQRKAHCA